MALFFIPQQNLSVISRLFQWREKYGEDVAVLSRPWPSSRDSSLITAGCSSSWPSSMCQKHPAVLRSELPERKSGLPHIPQPMLLSFAKPELAMQQTCRSSLAQIEQLGGEGLIVRQPDALYTGGRSTEILKVKNYEDGEAKVIAHLPGKGRNEGRMGALLVELDDGRQFKIGGGFTDALRTSPPPIGCSCHLQILWAISVWNAKIPIIFAHPTGSKPVTRQILRLQYTSTVSDKILPTPDHDRKNLQNR